ncbi:MAG TPA: DUF4344 domain-containing metallopeptidase [Pyrinomonadaceae bacterium]|nr:DUF4344 domain-containing metallopeptidase [Pyrinomonadaceae bacterium]
MKLSTHSDSHPQPLRRPFAFSIVLVTAFALLLAGCSKKEGATTGGTPFGADGNAGGATTEGKKTASRGDLQGMADQQGQATAPDRGNFKIAYSEPQNEKYAQMNEELKKGGSLEQVATELNAAISIPEDVTIVFKECGEINAQWSPSTRSIEMCYELIEDLAQRFSTVAKDEQQLEDAVGGAITFVFFHELGHALIDLLKLPSTGREEDAVDQLATYVLVDSGGEEGERMAISGAMWWGQKYDELVQSGRTAGELDQLWADEHSLNAQRMYNIICWVYGHNQQKYAAMVNNPLPEARAVRCPTEYERLSSAWLTLLKPYLKDGGAAAGGQ